MAAFWGFTVAQVLKVFTHYYSERRWDVWRLLGSGGMPSSHSAFVMGLVTGLGVKNGTTSDSFALAFVLAAVVMYDATGVRQHAGKHASILNLIISELPPEHPAAEQLGRPLKSALGHTPLQVLAGALLGACVGYVTIHAAYMPPAQTLQAPVLQGVAAAAAVAGGGGGGASLPRAFRGHAYAGWRSRFKLLICTIWAQPEPLAERPAEEQMRGAGTLDNVVLVLHGVGDAPEALGGAERELRD